MKLYTFQKSLKAVVRYLNTYRLNFWFRSVGSCHCMIVPCAPLSALCGILSTWLDSHHPYYEYKDGYLYIV